MPAYASIFPQAKAGKNDLLGDMLTASDRAKFRDALGNLADDLHLPLLTLYGLDCIYSTNGKRLRTIRRDLL